MSVPSPIILTPVCAVWPTCLAHRMGKNAPPTLQAIGSVALLANRKTALFCSARAPGGIILDTHDTARHLRDKGVTVISGFHSPIEKECLEILLRGKQPIIICPARSLEGYRVPVDWRRYIAEGRLLLLSPFGPRDRRVTVGLANRRNAFVAALADEVFIAYAQPGSHTEEIANWVVQSGIPIRKNENSVGQTALDAKLI